MLIAQSCPSCGRSLSRVPARPEGVYGLALVACPACDLSVVRSKHPLQALLRSGRHWRNSALSLAVRVAVLGGLILGSVWMAGMIREAFSGYRPWGLAKEALGFGGDDGAVASWITDGGRRWLLAAACWFALVGGVLTGSLRHIRRRWLILFGFSAACFLVLGLSVAGDLVATSIGEGGSGPGAAATTAWHSWTARGTALLIGLAAAPVLGWPLGRMLAASRRGARHHARRRMFTKARARRRAA